MGNVVVAIKPSSSGGASGVTRYIAESKRNPEKEGLQDKEPRPLFSSNEDRLTYLEANELLAQTSGSLAEKEDLVHIVISLEKEDFEQLGETREEQTEAFKEIIREAAENEVLAHELSPDTDPSQTNHEELAQGNKQINPPPVVSDTNNIAPDSHD